MIEVSNSQIINYLIACCTLINKTLPIKLAYAIRYNKEHLMNAYEVCESQKKEIIEKHAKKDDKGNFIIDESGNYTFEDNKVFQELNELLSITIATNIKTVSVDVLEKIDDDEYDNISAKELDSLMFMICD